jgi:hypothetical protein
LIEMLVALVLVATALASITGLVASTARAARSVDGFLPLLSTARSVMTALPDRGQIAAADLSGALGEHQWRVQVAPFSTNQSARAQTPWIPELIVVTVQTRTSTKQFSTIRLHRKADRS